MHITEFLTCFIVWRILRIVRNYQQEHKHFHESKTGTKRKNWSWFRSRIEVCVSHPHNIKKLNEYARRSIIRGDVGRSGWMASSHENDILIWFLGLSVFVILVCKIILNTNNVLLLRGTDHAGASSLIWPKYRRYLSTFNLPSLIRQLVSLHAVKRDIMKVLQRNHSTALDWLSYK